MVTLGRFDMCGVEMALKKRKLKRGLGPDGIPAYIYKACNEFLALPLTHISKVVVQTSMYLRSWTVSKVVPIPKEASTTHIADHRPMAMQPIPSKIFEMVVFSILYPPTQNQIT